MSKKSTLLYKMDSTNELKLAIPSEDGIEVFGNSKKLFFDIYAKNGNGEFYAKDENKQEYPNDHAYARTFSDGQYYPKLLNNDEYYHFFGGKIQKYAKDKKGNQKYAKKSDSSEFCAFLTDKPRPKYYYAKMTNRQEHYPIENGKEIPFTGKYARSVEGEELYPKIFYESE